MAEITLKMLSPNLGRVKHTNVAHVLHRKVERGFEFDASGHMPFFDTAIIIFRVVCPCIYLWRKHQFREKIPGDVVDKLRALENQVYRGPNKTPRPNCVNPVFAALGIGMKDEMSHMEWQQWANLGTMSTKSAAAKFLYELSKFHPGIFDESFESDGKTLSVKSAVRILAAYIIQRAFRQRKAYRPLRIIGRKIEAFEKLQRYFKQMIRRKHLIETRLFAQEKNCRTLVEILLRGIPIKNLIDGKMVPEYLSIFKIGEADIPNRRMGRYILYTSSKEKAIAATDMEAGILLSDVAEIRFGCEIKIEQLSSVSICCK